MNEERIKERCKREDIALKIVKGFLKKDCYTDTELEYSLNTLLDLYNKQKEEIKEEKEKWKELFHEYNKLVGEVIDKEQDLKDSISKDKIKKELLEPINKERQETYKEFIKKGKDDYHGVEGSVLQELNWVVGTIEELLEEK